jgi:phosphoglycolate phosphatase
MIELAAAMLSCWGKMGSAYSIVGFDLDGTLLDTSGDLTAALNHALATVDRPPVSPEGVRPMIGLGAMHMLRAALCVHGALPDLETAGLHRLMLDFYEANIAVVTRPFVGAVAALDELKGRGARLAVVTNKSEHLARRVLSELALLDRFDTVIGGDTLGPGSSKPSAQPILAMINQLGGGRAAYVGDSRVDVVAAHAAGIPAVAVSFGFRSGPVAELAADVVIDRYDQLLPALVDLAAQDDPAEPRTAIAGSPRHRRL